MKIKKTFRKIYLDKVFLDKIKLDAKACGLTKSDIIAMIAKWAAEHPNKKTKRILIGSYLFDVDLKATQSLVSRGKRLSMTSLETAIYDYYQSKNEPFMEELDNTKTVLMNLVERFINTMDYKNESDPEKTSLYKDAIEVIKTLKEHND